VKLTKHESVESSPSKTESDRVDTRGVGVVEYRAVRQQYPYRERACCQMDDLAVITVLDTEEIECNKLKVAVHRFGIEILCKLLQ